MREDVWKVAVYYEFYYANIFVFFFPFTLSVFFCVDMMERRKILYSFFTKFRIKDLCLITLSLLFYMWACFDDVVKLGIYIFVVRIIGYCIYCSNKFYVSVFECGKRIVFIEKLKYLRLFCFFRL